MSDKIREAFNRLLKILLSFAECAVFIILFYYLPFHVFHTDIEYSEANSVVALAVFLAAFVMFTVMMALFNFDGGLTNAAPLVFWFISYGFICLPAIISSAGCLGEGDEFVALYSISTLLAPSIILLTYYFLMGFGVKNILLILLLPLGLYLISFGIVFLLYLLADEVLPYVIGIVLIPISIVVMIISKKKNGSIIYGE